MIQILRRHGKLAAEWGVTAYASPEEAAAVPGAVFDLATPPDVHADVLRLLPDGAAVLIQKPMGSDLAAATEILKICRDKNLKAAVNFQLRFAPMMLALKDAIAKGWLGEIVDFDAWLALATPWQLWPFLKGLPRIEIAMHSIHYLDLIRQLLGDPHGVHAKIHRPPEPRCRPDPHQRHSRLRRPGALRAVDQS
jgi:predicted dehydrogenase